ncbi:hypothetical protein [Desulfovibrio oxyclinae]|uniref:hypothetical protein n=1 Tax=Desulfovibrio oxyclinae TaxID=63560 RepID=UPI000381625A|nr:hypothetical protein [Desulfovibrio oxyclinae]
MTKDWVQHLGDDQLVYGMPKRMVGVSTQESLAKFKRAEAEYKRKNQANKFDHKEDYYWTVHPKPKACEKCRTMAGKEFMEEPERPHLNCKCEIKKHPLRKQKRYINGSLSGHEWHRFKGGKHIHIRLKGIWGGVTTGVWLEVNDESKENVACPPQASHTINLTSDEDAPVTWTIRLLAHGSDNIQVDYTIIYEDWND